MGRRTIVGLLAIVGVVGGCEDESEPASAPESTESRSMVPGEHEGTTFEDVRRQAGEAAETARDWTAQARDEYIARLEKELDEFEPRLEAMEEKLKDLSGDARTRAEAMIAELKEKRVEVAEDLTELREKSGAAWSDFKAGLDRAFSDLKESYNEAAAHFQQEAEDPASGDDGG